MEGGTSGKFATSCGTIHVFIWCANIWVNSIYCLKRTGVRDALKHFAVSSSERRHARARWTDLMTLLDNQTRRSLANEPFSGRLLLLVVSTNYSNIFKFARFSLDGHILWRSRWWFSLGFPFFSRKMRKTWKLDELHRFCLAVCMTDLGI